jgi:hypothetical protein
VVVPDVHVEGGEPAVVVVADPDLLPLLPLVRRGDEVLAAVLRPLDLGLQRDRRHRHQQLLGPRVHDLDTEAAAHVRGDHLDLVERQLELGRYRRAHRRRRLGAGVHAQRGVVGVPLRVHALALHRHGRAALDVLGEPEGARRGRQRGLDVAGLLVVDGADVVRDVVVHGGLGRAGGVHPDDDGQFLVRDGDPLGHVLCDVPVGGDHHDHRLADVPDDAVRQRVAGARRVQLRVGDEHRQRLGHRAGQVLVGVDRDQPLDVEAALDVDAGDAGVRVRRPHERGSEGVVADVVEVAALADDQPGVLPSADRLPEQLGRHRRRPSGLSVQKVPARDGAFCTESPITGHPASRRRRGARPS